MQNVLKHRNITLERCEKFVSDSLFLDANLRGKLYRENRSISSFDLFSPPYRPKDGLDGRIAYAEAMQGTYVPASLGKSIGPSWSSHWIKVSLEIPHSWAGETVHFIFDAGCEALIWKDGKPIQGLSGGDRHDKRLAYKLTNAAQGGEIINLVLELACNGLFGVGKGGDIFPPDEEKHFAINKIEIAILDTEAWKLFWDYTIIVDMAKNLPAQSSRGSQALFAANKIVNACKVDNRETWKDAQQIADNFLKDHNGSSQHEISAIVDTAWLWPYAETQRKCARSWATTLRLIEDYPSYKFGCSQAQQYEWLEEKYPTILSEIKIAAEKGQFIPLGGTWVEMDGNIPSGESFVRQFLFGQKYFKKTFGKTCDVFWLPDTFGYSAQLPQIMRLCGIKYFLTQKLSWNIFNKFPHHSFTWEGIDGSKILTHFPPVDSYTSSASVRDLLHSVSNYKDIDRSNESLLVYGWGDGGGGPTPEMLEVLTRARDVDGLPKVEHQDPSDFFQKLEKRECDLNTWVGELYFELHRGTYTTQAHTKLGNRKSEIFLHDVEAIYAIQSLSGLEYPRDELSTLWKYVLLNQFHDVLPGSSIASVYEDAIKYYEIVLNETKSMIENGISHLISSPSSEPMLTFVNTLCFERAELVVLPDGADGIQKTRDGRDLGFVTVPSFGHKSVPLKSFATIPESVSVRDGEAGFEIENQFIIVSVALTGEIKSIIDKRANHREVINQSKTANRFVMYDDIPLFWDAWDVEVYHLEKQYPVGSGLASIVESGPARVTIKVETKLTELSSSTQFISVGFNSADVTVECAVDWHESHKFLKVEFPLNLRSPQATYEIQYGHLQRPTHFNTSWDAAKFEVCAQKWADLSEHGYGVSLVNDCKYGYATHGNIMRLSLLRSSKYPDPNADMGNHRFRYMLSPHLGSFQAADIIQRAYAFNYPLHSRISSNKPGMLESSNLSVSSPAVIVDCVKLAENGEDIIVRLYEGHGSRGNFKLHSTTLSVTKVTICTMLEEPISEIPWEDGSVSFFLSPFQVLTLKLSLQTRSRKRKAD